MATSVTYRDFEDQSISSLSFPSELNAAVHPRRT